MPDDSTGDAVNVDEVTGNEVTDEEMTAAPPAETPAAAGLRRRLFVAARIVVVLVVAAVGYQEVVPVTHVVRSRLARLVVDRPGVTALDRKPSNSAEVPASTLGFGLLRAAVKQSPTRTGSFAVAWTNAASHQAVEVIALLVPNQPQASRLLAQVSATELGVRAQAANGLVRRSTSTVPGVPGSSAAVFGSSQVSDQTNDLAVASYRSDSVVVLAESLAGAASGPVLTTAARTELQHLRRVGPGFTLSVVDRPLVASLVWVAGSLVAAALAGFGPLAVAGLRRRRERKRQEELDRMVLVRGRAIVKHRRVGEPRS